MTDGVSALLAATIAEPDDEAARRVYGDALQRVGDPAGELVAVQCDLRTRGAGADGRALERREVALIRTLLPAWQRAHGLAADEIIGVAGGFPSGLRLPLARFRVLAPKLASAVPVARLELGNVAAAWIDELAQTPALATLETLELSDVGKSAVDAAAVRTLAASPHLGRLRQLKVWGLPIGGDGIAALVGSPRLARLVDLEVGRTGKVGARALGAAIADPAFARLRAFAILDTKLGVPGARAIAAAPNAHGLHRLALSGCGLTAAGMQVVLASTTLTALVTLGLRENRRGRDGDPTDDGRAPVVVGEALAHTLKRLDLTLNVLDDDWARAFAATRPLALTHLDLRNNRLGAAGVRALVESPNLAALESLSVAAPSSDLAVQWGSALASVVALPGFARLVAFNADHCGVTPDGVAALAASPHAANLRDLKLSFSEVGVVGARALATSPYLGALEVLDLKYAKLGVDGLAALCAGTFPHLRHLALAGNGLGAAGLAHLAAAGQAAFPALRSVTLYEAKDPVRAGLEDALGAIVDVGDFPGALGLRPPAAWTE